MNLKISVYAENKKAKPFLPPFPASGLLALLLTPPASRRCGPEHKHWPASASLLQLCRGPLLLLAQLRSKPGQSASPLPLPLALGPTPQCHLLLGVGTEPDTDGKNPVAPPPNLSAIWRALHNRARIRGMPQVVRSPFRNPSVRATFILSSYAPSKP